MHRIVPDPICPCVYLLYPLANYPKWLVDQYKEGRGASKIDFWHPLMYWEDERKEWGRPETLADSLDDGLDYIRGYEGDR